MKEKLPKEKKPTFFQRFKEKVDQIFKNDDLTFLGQVYMLAIYFFAASIFILAAFGVVSSIINCMLTLARMPSLHLFTAATVMIILADIVCLVLFIALTVYEAYVNDADNSSILTKNKGEK